MSADRASWDGVLLKAEADEGCFLAEAAPKWPNLAGAPQVVCVSFACEVPKVDELWKVPSVKVYADGAVVSNLHQHDGPLVYRATRFTDPQKWYFTKHLREFHPVLYRLLKAYQAVTRAFRRITA